MKNWFLITVLGIFLIINSACEEGTSDSYSTAASTQSTSNSSTVVESNGHPVEIYAKSLDMSGEIEDTRMKSAIRPGQFQKNRSSVRGVYAEAAGMIIFYLFEKDKEKKRKAE